MNVQWNVPVQVTGLESIYFFFFWSLPIAFLDASHCCIFHCWLVVIT